MYYIRSIYYIRCKAIDYLALMIISRFIAFAVIIENKILNNGSSRYVVLAGVN